MPQPVGPSPVAITAQQYFPTYQIPTDPEITLKEYDLSAQGLAADQRGISVAAGLLVLLVGGVTSIAASDHGAVFIGSLAQSAAGRSEALIYLAVVGLSLIAIRYLTELQKSATHGARKIIILRRLLGIDYGNIERVLPSDRLEGANEPFAIHLFPGWGATVSLAATTVAGVAGYAMFGLATAFLGNSTSIMSGAAHLLGIEGSNFSLLIGVLTFLMIILSYRRRLFEEWETYRFQFARFFGATSYIPLKRRMGHVLYRMELAVFEAKRLGIDLDKFKEILVHIEDRGFYKHNGNSIRAAIAALYRYWKYRTRGGASTIAQQLVRSNLISVIPRDETRKIMEWILAPWFVRRYPRRMILDLYLCSVRFASGVEGVPAALRYYFNAPLNAQRPWNPSKAEIFFLIERLSNVSRSVPLKRVRALVRNAKEHGLLEDKDVAELEKVYQAQVRQQRLLDPGEAISF